MIINTLINRKKTTPPPPIDGLWSWGLNANNQLGDGTTTDRSSPVYVNSAFPDSGTVHAGVVNLECGKNFTLYTESYKLYGWGANNLGQLGDSTTTQRSTPIAIQTDQEIMMISCGDTHSAAVDALANSGLFWGQNNYGQLGDGTTTNRSSPVVIVSPDFIEVTAGASATMGISYATSPYELYAWGYGNDYRNNIGYSTSTPNYLDFTPTQFKKLRMGGYYGFAFDYTPSIYDLYGWGNNTYGNIGDGTSTDRNGVLQNVGGIGDFTMVRPSLSIIRPFTIAIKSDGTLWGWGGNNLGQLGLNDTTDRSSPVMIASGSWVYCAAGYDHALAIKYTDNTLWAWGDNRNGQLGDNSTTNRSSPVQIGSGAYIAVSAGSRFTVAQRITP